MKWARTVKLIEDSFGSRIEVSIQGVVEVSDWQSPRTETIKRSDKF